MVGSSNAQFDATTTTAAATLAATATSSSPPLTAAVTRGATAATLPISTPAVVPIQQIAASSSDPNLSPHVERKERDCQVLVKGTVSSNLFEFLLQNIILRGTEHTVESE